MSLIDLLGSSNVAESTREALIGQRFPSCIGLDVSSGLTWSNAMARFFRWVPKQHAEKAIELGLLSHNGSAMWMFDLDHDYRPRPGISRNAYLIAYDLDETATINVKSRDHISFEDESYVGEGAHPAKIIVKDNEPGAYGLGRMRQGLTNHHTTTGYATKKEVAKALELSEIEVSNGYKPPTGWPR